MSVNKVILIGHIGKDPEVRHLDSGVAVASFSLATNESYTDKSGNKQTLTEWHNIVIWGKLAEVMEKYGKKGQLIYVEGSLKTESYDKDGEKRYVTKIKCDSFKFLGSKSESSGNKHDYAAEVARNNSSQTASYNSEVPAPEPNDLPF